VEPAVVVTGPPAPADTIPPPRAIPLAAEPTDAKDAVEVYAVAKKMTGTGWAFQHHTGYRQTDKLYLPVGRPVRLTVTSEEGEKRLEIPAFALAIDAVAGEYRSKAVIPKRTGEFSLWRDREQVGTVVVVKREDYDAFLAGAAPTPAKTPVEGSAAFEGKQLFLKLQCANCHTEKADKAPNLVGLFGAKVKLKGGETAVADEAYILESIVNPRVKVREGWEPIMPGDYRALVTEEELSKLVAYIRSIKNGQEPKAEQFPPPVGAPIERKKPGG
jgi:cytochrome c oxidase subunit 2